MDGFDLAAAFLVLIGAVGWLNARFLRWPTATTMVLAGMGGAGLLLGLRRLDPGLFGAVDFERAVVDLDFPKAVIGYMLAFLLFAGAMQVNVGELRRRLATVAGLATLGVVASTFIVGVGIWQAAAWLGLRLSFGWAVVFGALISPTDPIAVLAAVRQGGLSKGLEAILQGEALFNDGVGIVVVSAAVAVAARGAHFSVGHAIFEVLVEAIGGLALGVVSAWLALRAIREIEDHAVIVGLTLALTAGAYSLGDVIHVSGPIAVVAAGMMLGGGMGRAMSALDGQHVRAFWTLVDEILNALLFLILGLELLVVPLEPHLAGLWLAAVVLVLGTRLLVVMPWGLYLRLGRGERAPTRLLAWGGLHGALSLALAFSLPASSERSLVLSTTFAVVIFSVVVQGLSFGPLAARLGKAKTEAGAP